MSALLERVKNIPLLESALNLDYSDVKMTTDSIPEANNLAEKYITGIVSFFEQDYDQVKDIIIEAHQTYANIKDRLAENSMLHCFELYCDALICIMHNNTKAGLYYMLTCDQFLEKHDPNSLFRIQTMPSIAEFNYSIDNIENGNSWMNATWKFIKDRQLEDSIFALQFLMTYAERKAIEKDNDAVDSIYNKIFDILRNEQADNFLVKDLKASYMWQLLQSERFDELYEYSQNLQIELDRYDVRDAEMLLFCNVLNTLNAYAYEDLNEAEEYLGQLDEISRWLFTTQMPKLPNEFRMTYWENQIRSYLDLLPKFAQLIDSPNYRKMLYNMQLLTNGALLSSNCSFEDIAKKSKNPTLVNMYANFNRNRINLDRLKNVFGQEAYNEKLLLAAEQLSLENDMLKEIKKEGSILDWSLFNVESIQQSLGKRDIAIEFFATDAISNEGDIPIYYAMVIGKDIDPKMIPLFNEELLINMDSPEVIYDNLWKPILSDDEIAALKVKNVYFSPAAKLCNIPIENSLYLHPKKCNAYRMSSTRYIIVSQRTKMNKNAALFGGMWYNIDTPPSINGENCDGIYEYLPHTLSEIKSVDRILSKWDCDLKEGVLATEDNFKSLSGHSPRVLLIATHGIFSDERGDDNIGMSRTGLLMSGAESVYYKELQKGEEDGFLFASEIEDLNLSTTDLVVLSGCRTGLGSISGEGVYGLQRGFKRAGVNTIIMSLNDVRDDAAEQFVTCFFENYVKTQDKYKSFDQSREIIRKLYPDFSVWGSFVMIDGNS